MTLIRIFITQGVTAALSGTAAGTNRREATHGWRDWGEVSLDWWASTERTEAASGVASCGSRVNRLTDRVSRVRPDKV
jgi:hypothetical protein